MSFLAFLSPQAYYSLMRSSQQERSGSLDKVWKLDILLPVLRTRLSRSDSRPPGAIIATLQLSARTGSEPLLTDQIPSLGRPNFKLPSTSMLAALDHTFPEIIPLSAERFKESDIWLLDFTDGGQSNGIVMTRSRMQEIQLVIDPVGAMGNIGLDMNPFPGTWLNLLVRQKCRTQAGLLLITLAAESCASSL